MPLSGIELSAGIVVGGNKPVDAKFGPYASTAAALADIGSTLRYKGLTVGIENAGQVVEYWFRNGVANADLVEKIPTSGISDISGLQDNLNEKQFKTIYSDTAPANPSESLRWVDTTTMTAFEYIGTAWIEIADT